MANPPTSAPFHPICKGAFKQAHREEPIVPPCARVQPTSKLGTANPSRGALTTPSPRRLELARKSKILEEYNSLQ
jgi:hypothetical protein